MSEEKPRSSSFPAPFRKIMGAHHPEFENTILDVIREHAPDTEPHQISTRPTAQRQLFGRHRSGKCGEPRAARQDLPRAHGAPHG